MGFIPSVGRQTNKTKQTKRPLAGVGMMSCDEAHIAEVWPEPRQLKKNIVCIQCATAILPEQKFMTGPEARNMLRYNVGRFINAFFLLTRCHSMQHLFHVTIVSFTISQTFANKW